MKIKPQEIKDEISGLRILFTDHEDDRGEMSIMPLGQFMVAQRDLCFEADGSQGDTGSFIGMKLITPFDLALMCAKAAYEKGREDGKPDGDDLHDEISGFVKRMTKDFLYEPWDKLCES